MKNNLTKKEEELIAREVGFFESASREDLVTQFPLYLRRQVMARYFVRYELFKRVLDVKGSIVECGVHKGASLLLLAKLSAMLEPYSLNRQIIGFDTFEGFPSVHENDDSEHFDKGEMNDTSIDHLQEAISIFDENRPIGHVDKIIPVKGDACLTIPKYFEDNPHTLVSLLYLDFDIYEPTKVALDVILPRMPKGAIVAFDELHQKRWQGETIAFLEKFDVNKIALDHFNWEPHISFFEIGG